MTNKTSIWTDLSWKVRLPMYIITLAGKFARRSDGTVNRRLMNLFDFKAPTSSKPINGVKTFDIIVDPSRNLWFRLYIPTADDGDDDISMPVIIYFHGGGFAWMSANSVGCDRLCRRFARELAAVIISVNYRNSPEYKYPCQREDGFDVLKFIENNMKFEGFPTNANLKNCFIGGDSAGGNLAHHVALKVCNSEFRNLKIIGVVSIQPFFGGEERTESEIRLVGAPFFNPKANDWLWRAFLPEGSDRNHPAANIFGPKSDEITGLNFPATIVIVGGLDALRDWQKRYYEGLKKCGKEAYLIEYPNAFHAFYSFPELPESSLLINELKDFMQMQSTK
ncbi:Alpha/beta hydrolase-3 [Melia azedarach]|uniref:Alpha/beta hydrolase-3 n=1 Tax=Melia azedarach TaxID=155640 RepID=A0ACC1XRB5_MELAZ|nr:Alpha/beta hydrolase-3 [Melia azedarach]